MIHCHNCNKEVFPEIKEVKVYNKLGGIAILQVLTEYKCGCGCTQTTQHPKVVEVQ